MADLKDKGYIMACIDTSVGADNMLMAMGSINSELDKSKGVVPPLNVAIATAAVVVAVNQIEVTLDAACSASIQSEWHIRVNGSNFDRYVEGVDGAGSTTILITCTWADFIKVGDVVEVSHPRAASGITGFDFMPVVNSLV